MWLKYSVVSSALTSSAVWYAWKTRDGDFFPVVVFLVTSKVCAACLWNQALVLTLLIGRLAKTLFLGTLRDAEVELLYENARYAITETCLALTIFREELTSRVLALFTALLFAKTFHWLVNSRVDYLEHAETPLSAHIRLSLLMCWLFWVDCLAMAGCAYVCLTTEPSVLVLFGFEFGILGVALQACVLRYLLHALDWPNKSTWLFAVDFAAEATRFLFYIAFFGIVFRFYGVPLHIVRELWVSYVSLKRRLAHYRRYRALTANMDERFPDATQEELDRDRICIICRERMEEGKKLPCGHVFHLACLRLWLQQQQSCPTCRADIPVNPTPVPQQVPPQVPQPVPQGARVYRVNATINVLTEKRTEGPTHRTISQGAHVLAVIDDDPRFLRLGDGWILNDHTVALLDTVTPPPVPPPVPQPPPPPVQPINPINNNPINNPNPNTDVLLDALHAINAQLADLRDVITALREDNANLRSLVLARLPDEGGADEQKED